jgi:DNA-binding transcriptional regulator YiaG
MISMIKADEIKAVRKAMRLTAKEFAELLGVTENTVNRWETGVRIARGPAALLIKQLAKQHPISQSA